MHLLIAVLRVVALLLAFAMLLGGGYYAASFIPRFLHDTDDSLSLFFSGFAVFAMLWGGTILWTMYRAFHMPDPEERAEAPE